jgi:hypothetical protein
MAKRAFSDLKYLSPDTGMYESGKARAMHELAPEAMGEAPFTLRHPIISGALPAAAGGMLTGWAGGKLADYLGYTGAPSWLASLAASVPGAVGGWSLYNYLVNAPHIEAAKARFGRTPIDAARIKQLVDRMAGRNLTFEAIKGAMSPSSAIYDKGYSDLLRAAATGQPEPESAGLPLLSDILYASPTNFIPFLNPRTLIGGGVGAQAVRQARAVGT